MVTDVVPLRETTPHAVMHAVIYQAPPPREGNPGLPEAVKGVLLKALAKEPGERFQSGRGMAEALGWARRGKRVAVPSPARGRVEPMVAAGVGGVPRAAWVVLAAAVAVGLVIWLVLSARGAGIEKTTAQAQTRVAAVWTATAQAGEGARATQDAQATEDVKVTPDDVGSRSGTETAEAAGREGMRATAEATGWQATQPAIATATEIDVAVKQTAEAMATRMASEATQTALARPTDTPVPRPTDTPNPSPTLQPTPRPTPRPTRKPAPVPPTPTPWPSCATQPGWPFDAMGSAPKLGCATSPSGSTHYSHQYFEGDQMIYRGDLRHIYVLYHVDNTWEWFHDTYTEGEPWQPNELDPPPGLKQPIKGFDRVGELNPHVLNKIGWAPQDAVGLIGGNFQDFENGTALWMSHPGYLTSFFLLFNAGAWGQRQG
jgi:hypothetical protein